MPDPQRYNKINQRFIERYQQSPGLWVQAPGRVDLLGSHTDYNEGFVLTQAIDRNTWIAARPRPDQRVRIASLNTLGESEFDLQDIQYDHQHPWTNYVRGVAQIFQQEGYPLQGFDGLIHSTIPFGSGLSSSAALEVATATLFQALGGWQMAAVELAKLCLRAEREFVGLNCGILDQYSSALGQANTVMLLDCRSITHQSCHLAAGLQVVICDTRAERSLTGSEYAERRAQCEQGVALLARQYPAIRALRDASLAQLEAQREQLPPVVYKRCHFIIAENQRVLALAEALEQGQHERSGQLALESFAGARDLYEIVSPEMQAMMDAMQSAPGFFGGRGAGAGFGGCLVAFVESAQVAAFSAQVEAHYQAHTSIQPQVYPVQAAAGAGVLIQE
ncbi:MAG: galactokinase [Anaerolineales bacterium]|nr:galactokinase [Anaerolineales bacterium]